MGVVKIGVIGYGYVGSSLAHGFATHKFPVSVHDIDQKKMQEARSLGFTTYDTLDSIVDDSKALFLCLPTPTKADGSCNIDYVEGVFKSISSLDLKEDKLVTIKSTVTPGTTNRLKKLASDRMKVLYCPEFLTEVGAKYDFLNPDRIVLSGYDSEALELAKRIHEPFSSNIIVTDPLSAEVAKYASNYHLALRVSFANEIKHLCEKIDANAKDVMKIVASDKRIGRSHLDPTKGPYGGSCLPKDTKALLAFSKEIDHTLHMLEATHIVNENEALKKNG